MSKDLQLFPRMSASKHCRHWHLVGTMFSGSDECASLQITVVDSHTFIKEFACRNPLATRPDLGGDQSAFRPVVDLLVEQIEVADYVVLNKVDLLGDEHVSELKEIIKSINPLCHVVPCSHAKV
jgi:G3E family GTPase